MCLSRPICIKIQKAIKESVHIYFIEFLRNKFTDLKYIFFFLLPVFFFFLKPVYVRTDSIYGHFKSSLINC